MFRRMLLLALCAINLAWVSQASAQQIEPRIALVIGNAGYGPGALPTALNDAGLVAEALRSVGFEILEGADLAQPDMLRTMRDFIARVDASGPDTLAFVYLAGHALSLEGENYLLGVDARLARESDIPIEALRLSDLLRPLADSPARAKVVMIDAARPLPFRPQGRGLAPGLEAMDAPPGMLIAYSTAPGTVAPDNPSAPYGAYATAIAEMMRAPGLDLETVFAQIRSRTHMLSDGRQTPWNVSNLGEPIELVPPSAASAALPPPPPLRAVRPMRALGPEEGYALAIEQDSLDHYVEYVETYPDSPYSERVWAMIRARREALVWMRALEINTPQSYLTYLRRYPNGIYAYDAERRLRRLSAPVAPPASFVMMALAGLPLALRGEPREYRPVYRVGPPPPRRFMPPPPPQFANLPPPRQGGPRVLPKVSKPIPVVPNLAPAPRHGPLDAGRPQQGLPPTASRPPGGPPPTGVRPPGVPPGPPPTGVRPPGAPPGPPPGAGRPPGPPPAPPPVAGKPPGPPPGRPPGVLPPGAKPPGPPPVASRPPGSPPGAPPPGAKPPGPPPGPPPVASKPPGPPPGKPPGAPPPGAAKPPGPPAAAKPPGPPQGAKPPSPPPVASRPPPPAARPPAPPPAAKPAPPPPPRVAAPPPPRPAAAPPPQRPAPPPQQGAKPPACPQGKTLKMIGGKPVCA